MIGDPLIIVGNGKVGRLFSRAFRAHSPKVLSYRETRTSDWIPKIRSILILAVRDTALTALAEAFARATIPTGTVFLHCSGALAADVLVTPSARTHSRSYSVGRMHPYLSVVSGEFSSEIMTDELGPWVGVDGEDEAAKVAYYLLRTTYLRSFSLTNTDPATYHASAAVLSNGAVALANVAHSLLRTSGVSEPPPKVLLSSILRSVADNIERFGVNESLSGPVRRGDLNAIMRIVSLVPQEHRGLVLASLRQQTDIARTLGEENTETFQAISDYLQSVKGA